jgi:carotenoid 1,2-hydratase
MTERGADALARTRETLAVGPSRLAWENGVLTIALDEIAVPWPRRVRGKIVLHAGPQPNRGFALDAAGRHRWQPISPRARVEVRFSAPDLAWSGHGYCDTNDGDRPLAGDFLSWDWARESGARTRLLYDAVRRDGSTTALALALDQDGRLRDVEAPPLAALPRGLWGVPGRVRSDPGRQPRILQRLEDGPFYRRSVVATTWAGAPATLVHESLSLTRFTHPVVQAMLPFRMPRRARG